MPQDNTVLPLHVMSSFTRPSVKWAICSFPMGWIWKLKIVTLPCSKRHEKSYMVSFYLCGSIEDVWPVSFGAWAWLNYQKANHILSRPSMFHLPLSRMVAPGWVRKSIMITLRLLQFVCLQGEETENKKGHSKRRDCVANTLRLIASVRCKGL